MKKTFPFLLLPLLLILTGCPYSSEVPLSAIPKTPIDKNLLGTWKIDEKKSEVDSAELKIFAFNKNEYYLDILGTNKGIIEIDRYRAFSTPVGSTVILNVENLKRKGSYNFYRYKLEGDKLTFEIVSDSCLTKAYNSPKELLTVFKQRIIEKNFFESGLIFVRKKEDESK